MGLNFKLDVGLYRLDQQVACQRYRQTYLSAVTNPLKRLANYVASAFAPRTDFAYATAA